MKKKILVLIAAVLLCFSLTACATNVSGSTISHAGMVSIEGEDTLYYDPSTRIVYIMFEEYCGNMGYGFMSPYYADNGLPYQYDVATKTLVKIGEQNSEKDFSSVDSAVFLNGMQ